MDMITPNKAANHSPHWTLRQAVRAALLAPRTATFGAVAVQHPITLAWDWFKRDESPNTDGMLWDDLLNRRTDEDDLTYRMVDDRRAKEAQTVDKHNCSIAYIVEGIVTPHNDEQMLIELTKSNGELLNLLAGVLDIRDIRDLTTILKMVEIHGARLFDWVEEYQIDHEDNGYHKTSIGSFVNGIRYLIFYELGGGSGDKTRVTFDMYSRLTSVEMATTRDGWGATLDIGEASEAEAKAFRDMVRHGITEERIERLQSIDYIIED